jgi:site-specific DNA recombinase
MHMKQNVRQILAELARMTPAQLRAKYLEVFGEPSRSGNKDFLFKRIAWRIQSLVEGGLMQTFDKHHVSFVSVTQQFNTTHSMGRLTLNILLSFAQFEREIISERTRDKIAAARRKGKFAGGMPLLGYDVVSGPGGAKLVVNEAEAEQVREIFDLYIRYQAPIPVVRELSKRGWANKRWTTRKGTERGGRPFGKTTLYHLLTNRTYLGLVTHKGEAHPGEHAAIVDKRTWERVRAVLGRNGRTAGAAVRNRYGALLKGILHCSCCRCSMTHTPSRKGRNDTGTTSAWRRRSGDGMPVQPSPSRPGRSSGS